jgi:hypothetical protein
MLAWQALVIVVLVIVIGLPVIDWWHRQWRKWR